MPSDLNAKAFVKSSCLSEAQLNVLRHASRKYDTHSGGKLHNGEVNTYGIMSSTLSILQERGLIVKGYKINDETERNTLLERANGLIESAWNITAASPPFSLVQTRDGSLAAWREVYSILSASNGIRTRLAGTCLLITDEGRKIAVEWKRLVGAAEE